MIDLMAAGDVFARDIRYAHRIPQRFTLELCTMCVLLVMIGRTAAYMPHYFRMVLNVFSGFTEYRGGVLNECVSCYLVFHIGYKTTVVDDGYTHTRYPPSNNVRRIRKK